MHTQFGPFILDSNTRQLLRGGTAIHLSPKAFDVLCALAEQRPNVMSKSELHARVWPGTFVVEANLSVLIGEIRRALSDTPEQSRYIRTVHRIGYAFCGPAVESGDAPSRTSGTTRCWLVWNDQTFPLTAGDNIIGRDPDCGIWLDDSGVSRHHARIRLGDGADAFLDDLGSTNGTFLRGVRVAGREVLTNEDVIRIGSVKLTFRMWSANAAKKTVRIPRSRS